MCSLRSLQYNMETKHEIHDEGGEYYGNDVCKVEL
jgi:hypothetical protein